MADNSVWGSTGEWQWSGPPYPINSRTGTYWTYQELSNALVGLHTAIKNAIGSGLLVCNGVYDGNRFYQHYVGYSYVLSNSPMNGFGFEYGGDRSLYTVSGWTNLVNCITWVSQNCPQQTSFVIVNQGIDENYLCATIELAQRAGQIPCMLGVSQGTLDRYNSLGSPLTDYTQSGGVYSRTFTGGTVYVNPSAGAAWIG